MGYFTEDNWRATPAQREIANVAFDEAWGAIKSRHQRMGEDSDQWTWEQIRVSLGDAVNNAFIDGANSETIAERALASLGYTPIRSLYSLECQ